ncbi:uncharacterized protein LOC144133603 [Amblyomma americanum]
MRDIEAQILFLQKTKVFLRYHVVHSENPDQPARKMSPFIVSKSLADALGLGYKVTKLASGDLLLQIRDKVQFSKLPTIVSFGDIPVSITAHRSLNTVKGGISEHDFLNLSEEEMLEGLKDQNATEVHRIKIRKDDKEIPTKHLILTFYASILPETIEVGYLKIQVRPYIPNPRRCFNCQRYGHGSTSCHGHKTCAKCASKEHATENCDAVASLCANCEGDRPAYSMSCQRWKTEKEIITLKTKENISFKEARKRSALTNPFQFTAKTNFADVVRTGEAPHPALATAQAKPPAGPFPSPADAAKAALPSGKKGTPAFHPVTLKASPSRETPRNRTPAGSPRPSRASSEAMDTTKNSPPLQRRNSSLDRKIKDRAPITGPLKT